MEHTIEIMPEAQIICIFMISLVNIMIDSLNDAINVDIGYT